MGKEFPLYSIIAIVAIVGLVLLFTGEAVNNEITGEIWGRSWGSKTYTRTYSYPVGCSDPDGNDPTTPGQITITYSDGSVKSAKDSCRNTDILYERICAKNRPSYYPHSCAGLGNMTCQLAARMIGYCGNPT